MYTEYNHVEYNFYVYIYIYLWYMVHYRLCFLIPTFGLSYDLVPWVSLLQVGRVTWCTWRREASKGRRIGEFEGGGKIYTPSRGVFFEICWLDYRFISSFFVGVVMYEWMLFITPQKRYPWLGFSRVFPRADGDPSPNFHRESHGLTGRRRLGFRQFGTFAAWWASLVANFRSPLSTGDSRSQNLRGFGSDPSWEDEKTCSICFFFGGGWYLI